ncbi:uncharacterized protein FOMMEDRAFT_163020 [Fomitiporia mediterranea MF3/22]|uniref:Uncharacterized protein n=1 Tax=Fomitiporia mediterranea (strain MF3/22) TaxID=694068 RepID=R7SGF3_FOMME|nr:uncharacterized protein FOMMEDRAFT_163020 [Fomitiporia mediterranea MF3/22]EJC97515.1 hypothetical protein FOMMEDRAFT_163020 [Fomitiporia mediterranea MF3/22]
MAHSENTLGCALDENNQLKDASKIVFFNDPDDEIPISGPGSHNQESGLLAPTQRPVRNVNQAKLHHAIRFQHDEDSDFGEGNDSNEETNHPPVLGCKRPAKPRTTRPVKKHKVLVKSSGSSTLTERKGKGNADVGESVARQFLKDVSRSKDSENGYSLPSLLESFHYLCLEDMVNRFN